MYSDENESSKTPKKSRPTRTTTGISVKKEREDIDIKTNNVIQQE